ncbi:MAG: PAS domain-containing protein [Alicyclobacillus sp.]|nr:PAS domain-containing protein [Alicyclobacillus sp.]
MAGLNAGLVYIDTAGCIQVWNELAAELLDYPPPIGERAPLEAVLGPEREEARLLRQVVHERTPWRNLVVQWTGRGAVRHVLMDSYPVSTADGDVVGAYVTIKDLGNFTMLDQHIQRTERLATVGKVAAGVAHEIRNPLTTVRGFLQVMVAQLERRGWPEGRQYVDMMLREIDKVDALVEELLLLSKPQQVVKRPCDVRDLIEDLGPWLEEQTAGKAIRIRVETPVQLPRVAADPGLLRCALQQLLENAIDAMEQAGTLTIRCLHQGQLVQVDIQDTGPGIPYYQMDKVFDAFFTTKEKGTGLGLPICQRIVADHGGEIRVASKGFGTTFSMLLPIGS